MNLDQTKQWINAMLYTAFRRGDSTVRFELSYKSGIVRSYAHDRHFLGTVRCPDWLSFVKAVQERRSTESSDRLRKGPPELQPPFFGEDYVQCYLDRESYIEELGSREGEAKTG